MSRAYDPTLKDLVDNFATDWIPWIAPTVGLPADIAVEPMDSNFAVVAEADKVFRLRSPHSGSLHLEPQSYWDDSLPARVLLYNVLIEKKFGGPVYSVVLLLRPEAHSNNLTSLLFTASYILLGLRYDDDVIEQLFEGVQEMLESSTYRLILKKGEAQGEARGEARGKIEGAVSLGRKSVLGILSDRFGKVPRALQQKIRKCADPDKLEAALRQAAKVKSLKEFDL